MDAPLNQVFFPVSFHELFSAWNRFPEAVPYAGGTNIIGKQEENTPGLPSIFLCLDKLEELQRIARTEHYLEIGSMVKLNRIIRLGKIVPEVLCICLENIAGVQLRNIATIGGNICSVSRLFDLPAPLTALDAQYELRGAHSTRWVSASRFHSPEERNVMENQELLTRIRLPLHQWDYSIYKKFNGEDLYNNDVLVFLAKAPKNILSDIRVVCKVNKILRNKGGEDILNGKHLPLSRKTADDFVENWKVFLSDRQDVSEFSKNALLNSIEENVFNLSE
jgi:CO/xanthine dehydrogenase FAD-binding subunit